MSTLPPQDGGAEDFVPLTAVPPLSSAAARGTPPITPLPQGEFPLTIAAQPKNWR